MISSLFNNNTKSEIILLLSYDFPLSAKEIHLKLKKKLNSVSYKAVHKALTELSKINVLNKKENKYLLAENWILNLGNYSKQLESIYINPKKFFQLNPEMNGSITLKFDDLTEFVVKITEIMSKQNLLHSGDRIGIGIVRHAYWPINFEFKHFLLLKDLMNFNKKTYCIIRKNMPLDKWIAKQYKKAGMQVKIGTQIQGIKDDFFVRGEWLSRINFTPKTKKYMNEIYKKNISLNSLLNQFINKKTQKVNIQLTITKDKQLAKIIKNQLLKEFN